MRSSSNSTHERPLTDHGGSVARRRVRRPRPSCASASAPRDPSWRAAHRHSLRDPARARRCDPGARFIARDVFEWRCDPSSQWHDPDVVAEPARQLIVICDEGYQSSLASATMQRFGFANATDVIGGFQAWREAGWEVERETAAEHLVRSARTCYKRPRQSSTRNQPNDRAADTRHMSPARLAARRLRSRLAAEFSGPPDDRAFGNDTRRESGRSFRTSGCLFLPPRLGLGGGFEGERLKL